MVINAAMCVEVIWLLLQVVVVLVTNRLLMLLSRVLSFIQNPRVHFPSFGLTIARNVGHQSGYATPVASTGAVGLHQHNYTFLS
jgi:hypothetical protein